PRALGAAARPLAGPAGPPPPQAPPQGAVRAGALQALAGVGEREAVENPKAVLGQVLEDDLGGQAAAEHPEVGDEVVILARRWALQLDLVHQADAALQQRRPD